MPAAAAAAPAGVWGPEHRNLTLGLIATVSVTAFESLAVATVLPAAVADIGGLEWYGWVFSGFMLANLVSITWAGSAADNHGVAQPFVLGCGLFVAGLCGAGLAPAMWVVVASRVGQGLGAGAIASVAYAAIARAYRADQRPRMLALVSSAWVVPGLIGPAIAGTVADHLGWRWIFLGLGPPTLVMAAVAVPSLRRLTPQPTAAPAINQTAAAVRLAAGTGAALYGMGCGDVRIAAIAVPLGAAVAVPALRRLLPRGTLRAAAGLPAAVATTALLGFAFFAAEAFLPLSLTQVRNQSTTTAGLALTAATVAWTTGAWLQARLALRHNRRRLTSAGLLLLIVGIAGIAAVATTTAPVVIAAIAWGAAGIGMGLAYSTATLVVLESASAGGEGAASAATQLGNVLGTAVGTGLGGGIVALASAAPLHSMRVGIGLVDLCAIAVAMVALLAAQRLPARPPSDAN